MKESLQVFLQYWQGRDPKERLILSLVATILLISLFYAYLWIPLHQQQNKLKIQVPKLTQELAQMKKDAQEITALRSSHSTSQNIATHVRQSLGSLGLKNPPNILPLSLNRIQVTFDDISFNQWMGWIRQLHIDFHLRVESTQIKSKDPPDHAHIQVVIATPESESI